MLKLQFMVNADDIVRSVSFSVAVFQLLSTPDVLHYMHYQTLSHILYTFV